ncbi:peptide methionine sulfoxide reductase [Maribacter halichondriae]|uniref:peptide methionine sulfoxide reductase n=1 Tax=Maribacter halichondriae TaxID=2980554 RepID=UPI002358F4B2|nr:peptide methionine sulfoxide reductase [Maribacter sp. Hal144]
MLLEKIRILPIGYSKVLYRNKKYGVTRTDFNSGKSIKLFAEELGGNDFISLNYYLTETAESLKPCEMPEEKVIDFLKGYKSTK